MQRLQLRRTTMKNIEKLPKGGARWAIQRTNSELAFIDLFEDIYQFLWSRVRPNWLFWTRSHRVLTWTDIGNCEIWSYSSISEKTASKLRDLSLISLLSSDSWFCFSPYYTLLLPLRVEPYTDGRAWARKEGYEWHRGLRKGEELTDEE